MAGRLSGGYNNNNSPPSIQFNRTLPPNCDTTPFNCNLNLVNPIFTDIKTTDDSLIFYGKPGTSYSDREYSSSNPQLDDCGVNTPCEINPDSSLYFFISYPTKPSYYYTCPLPVIFLYHPGGFSDCNSIASGMRLISREFAKRGYICVVAEYRRGIIKDTTLATTNPNPNVYYTGAPQLGAFYRGAQDGPGAIRTFIKWQRDGADNYRFKADTNNIFLAGFSAGGMIAILTAYYTQSMLNDISENIQTALGPRDIDYYVGGTNIEYKSKIKGVLAGWATAFLPLNDVNNPNNFFSQNSNNVPMIAFHGYLDPVNPVNTEPVYFSPAGDSNKAYHTIKNCLKPGVDSFSVTPRGKDQQGNLRIDEYRGGPLYYYYNIFNQFNTPPMECYIDCTMMHGLDSNGINFHSEFGTGLSNQDDVLTYIAQRTACFFQAILGGNANKLDRRLFFECENMRYGCDTNDNHESCPPNNCN